MKTQLSAAMAILCLAAHTAIAATTTVNFGWEDGTSTDLGSFNTSTGGVSSANVASGSDLDYGPSGAPFATPVAYDVTPFAGDRMLQITESPLGETSGGPRVFLGYVENLSDGDTVEFSVRGFDPSDGRSPSMLLDATYAQSGDIDSFAGFFTPFQMFQPGAGWLDISADAAPDGLTFPVDPSLVFDSDGGTRDAVVLRVQVFRPTLAFDEPGDDDYTFYVDDLSITVTSDNPDAQITLPDGSVTPVIPEPTTLALCGFALGVLGVRRRH